MRPLVRAVPEARAHGPAASEGDPKGLYGTSLWVEILVDKFYGQQPVERLLEQWRLHGLDLAAGTVTDGLQRLEPLFTPVYEALKERNGRSYYQQADVLSKRS
jgi:transposase